MRAVEEIYFSALILVATCVVFLYTSIADPRAAFSRRPELNELFGRHVVSTQRVIQIEKDNLLHAFQSKTTLFASTPRALQGPKL